MHRTAGLFLTLVVATLAASRARAGESIFVPKDALKIAEGGWTHFNGYMGKVPAGTESVRGEFVLPKTLPAGRYTFFVAGLNFSVVDVQISCGGGASKAITPDSRDWNGIWSAAMPVTVTAPSDRVTLEVLRQARSGPNARFLFQGLYVTDRGHVVVDRTDTVIDLTPANAGTDAPPASGNLLPNGSFEVGLGRGWGLAGGGRAGRDFAIDALWARGQGRHGDASVKLPPWTRLISRLVRVRPGRRHTASLWAKPETKGATIELQVYNAHRLPKELGSATHLTRTFRLEPGWQRLQLSGELTALPAPEYHVRVTARGGAVHVDALQLEEGDATTYRPREPLQVGLISDRPGRVFHDDEPVALRLRAFNASDRKLDATVSVQVYDVLNRVVKTRDVEITAGPGTTREVPLDLTTGTRGIFRAVLWTDVGGGAEEEVVWCVVPRPRSAKPDPESAIGVHANPSDFQLRTLRRLGVHWQRVLSPAAYFRWQLVEPTKGRYIWHDDAVRKTVEHGFTIVGCLHGIPDWANRDGRPDLEEWERYVTVVVNHYKPWVKWWEVWNEPIHQFKPAFYAQLLQRTARAIRKADPDAKIVGMGGSYSAAWCLAVIRQLDGKPTDHFDVLSTHLYPEKADPRNPTDGRNAKRFRKSILLPYKIPIWNTETGAWCWGFHKGPNASFGRPGEPLWPYADGWRFYRGCTREAERTARNFLHSVGNGFERYFYYDSRFHAAPDYHRSHCTLLAYDDTIRSKGVAYAVLARVFDHARGLGDVSPDEKAFAYLFDRGGTPVVALWAGDMKPKALNSSLTAERVQVVDMMGNPVAVDGAEIPFGRQPVYIVGRGRLSVDAMQAAVRSGTIRPVPDVTPPNVSICDGPRGTRPPGWLRIRWIAIDETSIATEQAPNAILYSYRLVGREERWSPWTPRTLLAHADLSPGKYRFEVKAKDEVGNVSAPSARTFRIERSR